jgi:multiple sugar transport system substrate-binding protein
MPTYTSEHLGVRLRVFFELSVVVISACAACILLSGCRTVLPASGKTEIVYWTGWSGHEFDVLQKLVDEYNNTHPDVHVRMLSVFGSYQKVRIAFAGGDTPDVCSAVWAEELAGYAMRGALTPLDGYLAKSGRSLDEWEPGIRDMVRYHDRTFGLLATVSGDFIVYNKKAFKERNLQPPTNLEEWARVNDTLTVRAKDGSYKTYGMRPNGLVLWAYIFGGHWFEPETGKITATHPKNVEALRFLQDFAKKNDIRRMEAFESTFGSMETTNGPFFVGKQLLLPTGPWIRQFLNRYAPKDLEVGAFPYPAPEGGRKMCSNISGSTWVIPAACKNKDEAWEFLEWMMRPEQNVRFCSQIGNGSGLTEVANMPVMTADPLMKLSAEISGGPNAFGPPQMPVWPAYQAAIARAEDQAVHGNHDPEVLLKQVEVKMERELKRVQREAVY